VQRIAKSLFGTCDPERIRVATKRRIT